MAVSLGYTYNSADITAAAAAAAASLTQIESDFLVSGVWKDDQDQVDNADVWPMNTLLRVYARAYEAGDRTAAQLKEVWEYTDTNYWEKSRFSPTTNLGDEGFWDDNGGMLLAALDAYDRTSDAYYLTWAKRIYGYMLGGECPGPGQTLAVDGGGLYQRENHSSNLAKVATSTQQMIMGALRLYAITSEADYLTVATRHYDWLDANLLKTSATSGDEIQYCYWQKQEADTTTVTGFTGSQAVHFDGYGAFCNLLQYERTSTSSYLTSAENTINASIDNRYWNASENVIAYEGKWCFKMIETLEKAYAITSTTYYRDMILVNANTLRLAKLDSNGRYIDGGWGQTLTNPQTTWTLNNQAGACMTLYIAGGLS